MGLGLFTPEIFLPNSYPPHVDEGPACSVWMDVVSLILYLSDFHSARFMMVLSDVCSNFRYNFDVIVQRGEPCLHMPPS